jgi:ribosome biogenesis GTPase / thiamine phosphate phosphatase
MTSPDPALGWTPALDAAWSAIGRIGTPMRVARLDRGWSSLMRHADDDEPIRVRNIGVDVAVGDWVVASDDGERVVQVIQRQSAFVRRASFEGSRAEAHTIAANIDVVFLVHALGTAPNQRRLERELVLAFDSGADPVVLVTKPDLVVDPSAAVAELAAVALGVPVVVVSGRTGVGLDAVRERADGHRTLAFLGASGVGKSTIVNALLAREALATAEVRAGDQRGRHTTVASSLWRLPAGGWLVDTPGVRAVTLWLSGDGIERAFADVFDLMDDCRFRDCKHDLEPGCAVQAAMAAGQLDPVRFRSLERLVEEEAAVEREQRGHLRLGDRRSKPWPGPDSDDEADDVDDD